MKKALFLLVVVMAAGCGESQLDRRAELETEENAGDSAAANEELEASEEAVVSPKETPKTPQAKRRPGDGKGQARPSQQGRRPGGSNRRNPYASLELSEEQQGKIDTIQQARTEEMNKLRESGAGGDFQARIAKYRELNEKYQKQTDAILTDEQKKKMAEERAQRPQGGQDGRGQGRRGQGERGNQFAALGVNEAQQKKLDAARQELSAKMRELFTDRNTPREERAPKTEKIREGYETKIKGILTEEQYKKYEETRSSREGQGGARSERGPQPKKNE